MIVNPLTVIQLLAIAPVEPNQIQPNSIDLTVKEILVCKEGGQMDCKQALLAGYEPAPFDGKHYLLSGHEAYSVVFHQHVKVPEDMAAFITHRSSLNRMGCVAQSGIYDSGFNNYVGAMLYPCKNIKIEAGARIATMFFVKADSARKYDGRYQGSTT